MKQRFIKEDGVLVAEIGQVLPIRRSDTISIDGTTYWVKRVTSIIDTREGICVVLVSLEIFDPNK